MNSLLFINRVYPPATGATGQLLAELAPALVRAGWKVTVVTGRSGNAPRSEIVDGVRVERVGGIAFSRASHCRRALAYLSLYPALLWRALRLPRHDAVVVLTDPPLMIALGPIIKLLKLSKLIHWAQDVYPELAEELGVIGKNGLLAGTLRKVSTWALRRCDRLIVIGRCMKDRLIGRGISKEAMDVIPNWGHSWLAEGSTVSGRRFREDHGFGDRFVIMYSGNLGMAHPFEAIVDAAEQLWREHPQALFVFVGDGPRLPWVKAEVSARGMENVRFLPFQPRERLSESLGAADIHLASMQENACGLVVPSKVYGVLAAGRPCVLLGPAESEAARLIVEEEFGDVVGQSSGQALAGCLRKWILDPGRFRDVANRAGDVSARVGLETATRRFDASARRALGITARASAVPDGNLEQSTPSRNAVPEAVQTSV